MGRKSARVLIFNAFIVTSVILFLISPKVTFANLSACSASVSPDTLGINTADTNVIFTVTNNDDSENLMRWIIITPPADFPYTGSPAYAGFEARPGDSILLGVMVSPGSTPVDPSDWVVQATDDQSGQNLTTCTGNLTMSIIDTSPPQISNVVVSNISNNSAVISWNTSKNAKSELDYGETDSYGFVKSDNSPATRHAYTLDSLVPQTTYHFNIKATDDNGTTELGDSNFTTAQTPDVTLAPQTITVTNTTTKNILVTPSPTPTPVPDTSSPNVYVSTDFSKPFTQAPQVTGIVKDNKSVVKIEYSFDGGKNWLSVDNISSPNKPITNFSFLPSALDDGNYDLRVRAFDPSLNIGLSKKLTMVIDRLPPQISGVLFSLGPQIVNPREDGLLTVLENQSLRINLSEVGGSIGVDVFIEPISKSGQVTSKTNLSKLKLNKNPESGLWSGILLIPKAGDYQLKVSAIDGAGNKTERNLNKLFVSRRGKINAPNSTVTVYFQDPLTHEWLIWDGKPYLQQNPQKTDLSGNYSLFLPTGKYYLQIDSYGYQTLKSDFFAINSPEPINANFDLKPLKLLLNLGVLKLYWPDFSIVTATFNNKISNEQGTNIMVDKVAPYFSLPPNFSLDMLSGKPSVLTFINTWSPASIEQVSILNKFAQNRNFNTQTVVVGEKQSKVYVFQKRGNYSLQLLSDQDATLVPLFDLKTLPVSYFMDRKGVVKKVVSGTLSEEELVNTLTNIAQ